MRDINKFLLISVSACISNLGSGVNFRCGVDHSSANAVKEGEANIETYPWLGLLLYPVGLEDNFVTTTIVLITKRMALAAALDIDEYPKNDFRARARVVLGHNCSGPYLNVLDYTYHPDFSEGTYSTIAIVQLDTKFTLQEVRPICPPPARMNNVQVYAMSLTHDCTSSMVRIYRMELVDSSECKDFYRRTDLDIASLWPKHFACARATFGGHCVWRSGTVLTVKEHDQWRLLGFGVNGPGCEAPARFLDYGRYHPWVKQSLARIGRPAITRISPSHIILRRSLDKVQRFGTCDLEETKAELFTDFSSIGPKSPIESRSGKIAYNLTLIANVDYSCVSLRVHSEVAKPDHPNIRLRRWCTNTFPICYDVTTLQVDFSVQIQFEHDVIYQVSAYGKEMQVIDVKQYRVYTNTLFFGRYMKVSKWDPAKHDANAASNFVTSRTYLKDNQFYIDPHKYGIYTKYKNEEYNPFLPGLPY